MNIPYVFRKCSKCGEWLVACKVNFGKEKRGKYGLTSRCKKCEAERNKQHYENNKDRILERHKQHYEDNKDKIREYYKQYRDNNRDKIKQYYEINRYKILEQRKQYYATPQGQVVAFNGNCRRRIREQNQGSGITKEQWLEMMQYFDWKCAYSGEKLKKGTRTIDHIKPLSEGGEHEIWNCVPMYDSYNFSKHDKDLLEWYKEQDFFSEERLQKIYEWQEYAYKKWGQ